MENQKKRPLTLAGSIVNIVFAAIDIILMIVACLGFAEMSGYYEGGYYYYFNTTPYIVACVIEILFATTILILASILCSKCKKSVQDYNKCSGLVITLFVFNCLAVISSLINIITGNYFAIVTMLVYAMCGTFVLVDFVRNKKELKALANESQTTETEAPAQPVVEQPVQPVVKEEKNEQKKRPLTLAGTIVNIVLGAIDVIMMIVACIYISDLYYQVNYYLDTTPFIIAYVFEMAFATTIVILASLLCGKCKRSVQEYNRCSGLVITLFVFNCLAVLSSLINLVSGNYFAIVTMLVYAMCGTFELVDLCRNKKALKAAEAPAQTAEVTVQPVAQPVMAPTAVKPAQAKPVASAPAVATQSKLYQTLLELKEMKDLGIITEEEFKKLKAKAVEKAEF